MPDLGIRCLWNSMEISPDSSDVSNVPAHVCCGMSGYPVDIYVISGFQGILDLSHTFGLCSSRWAFAPKDPCQAFVQVEVEVNKILQKDMLAEAPLEQETFYQLFCYAEDDWKIQALRALRPAVWVACGQHSRGRAVQSFQR